MEKIDYQKLYALQDEVLEFVNSKVNDFYLTGGTALNRFLFKENTRHSDDLDFFISSSTDLSSSPQEQIKEIITLLKNNFDTKIESSYDDFSRIIISKDETKLQVDFINDVVTRFGNSLKINGFWIDNPRNILSNKISAIMSRDEEKDIYDLYLLFKNIEIDWEILISEAQEKEHFQSSDFIARLKIFPVSLLDNIKTDDKEFLEEIKADFSNLVANIERLGQQEDMVGFSVEQLAMSHAGSLDVADVKREVERLADGDSGLKLK